MADIQLSDSEESDSEESYRAQLKIAKALSSSPTGDAVVPVQSPQTLHSRPSETKPTSAFLRPNSAFAKKLVPQHTTQNEFKTSIIEPFRNAWLIHEIYNIADSKLYRNSHFTVVNSNPQENPDDNTELNTGISIYALSQSPLENNMQGQGCLLYTSDAADE